MPSWARARFGQRRPRTGGYGRGQSRVGRARALEYYQLPPTLHGSVGMTMAVGEETNKHTS